MEENGCKVQEPVKNLSTFAGKKIKKREIEWEKERKIKREKEKDQNMVH